MATLPDGVRIAHPDRLFIAGSWVAPVAGGAIEIVSPHSEQVCAVVAEAGEPDMEAAVAAAREAFDNGPWPRMNVLERAQILRRMVEVLSARQIELETAYIAQIGALAPVASAQTIAGTRAFSFYAGMGRNYAWEVVRPSAEVPGHKAHILHEPVGVVAAITPWNTPYAAMAYKVAPALVAGCTVVMKPAPEAPLEAYILAEAAEAAGMPAGVLNLVPSHRVAADYLVRLPGVDKIAFTGSTAAGRRVASVAGERIARVTLELGGKSPAIVLDDFPAEKVGQILGRAATVLSGQSCTMLSRILVPAARQDEIADAIAATMRNIRIGSPLDASSEMGPVAMQRQRDRIEAYVEKGRAEGASLVIGGKRPAHLDTGYYYEPTLFADVRNDMTIAREEIFGPVLALIPYRDLDHAIGLANDSRYGLNSAVFTRDRKAVHAIGRRLRAGNVAHNGLKSDGELPFGGFKQSGIGRELGIEGLANYIETKTMLIAG